MGTKRPSTLPTGKKLYEQILSTPYKPLEPVRKRMDFSFQESLFHNLRRGRHAHVEMGLFYEILTMMIFGGRLTNNHLQTIEGEGGEQLDLKPDVTNRNVLYEAKACRMGHHVIFYDSQMEKYDIVQTMKPSVRIHFVMFRHSLHKIKSYNEDMRSLFKDLAERTRFALLFPYSIPKSLHDQSNLHTRHYDKGRWQCTSVPSTVLNEFVLNPEGALSRAGLQPSGRFKIEMRRVSQINIGRVEVPAFPIILYKDLQYADWVERLADETIPF